MNRYWLMGAAFLPSLGACAPLSQASLVYTSAATMGVGVRAPSAEGSGVSLTIGYGQVDAAYVPVMVARPCTTTSAGNGCTNATHPLSPIVGRNNVDRSDKALDDSVNQARAAAETATAEVRRLEREVDSINGQQDERNRRLGQAQAQNRLADQPAEEGATPPDRVDTTALEAEIARGSDDLAQRRDALARARETERGAATHYRSLVESVRSNDIDIKQDAYSVFGSFNGTAGGGAPATGGSASGNLTVGRAFSTGVASQHLTQGLRETAVAQGMAACLAEARLNVALVPVADRPALAARLSEACAIASDRSD